MTETKRPLSLLERVGQTWRPEDAEYLRHCLQRLQRRAEKVVADTVRRRQEWIDTDRIYPQRFSEWPWL